MPLTGAAVAFLIFLEKESRSAIVFFMSSDTPSKMAPMPLKFPSLIASRVASKPPSDIPAIRKLVEAIATRSAKNPNASRAASEARVTRSVFSAVLRREFATTCNPGRSAFVN